MEQENEVSVDVEKMVAMAKKERKTYKKRQDNNEQDKDKEPIKKRKKLIIRETIPPPASIIAMPSQPVIEKMENTLQETPRYNETFIEVLERLAKLMSQNGDTIRSRVYTRAQDTIRNMTEDITSVSQLDGKPNIGPTIKEKLTEYLATGTLTLFEREKDKPEHILSEIYGVGPKKAKDLVEKGITTIEQLRSRQDELLNDVQKAGLKYYEDILQRIPRTEIDEYNAIFKSSLEKAIDAGIGIGIGIGTSEYEIVGSYRRGAHTSGDIDLIITSDDPTIFKHFIDSLLEKEIIVEVLSRGKTKCLVITKLPNHKTARRVDFMYTSKEEYPFAVLYFTGSKTFNTVMRGHALKMALSLNEHGLYKKLQGKEKEEKISTLFKSERDIFDHLQLEFKEPEERIDGRSVVLKNGSIMPLQKPIFLKEKGTRKVNKGSPKVKSVKAPKEKKEKTVKDKKENNKPIKEIAATPALMEAVEEKLVEPEPLKKQKRTYKKRAPKDPNAVVEVKVKRTYKKRAKKEEIDKVEPILFSPLNQGQGQGQGQGQAQEEPEIPVVPVIPLETQSDAKIDMKRMKRMETKKIKEPKERKTRKNKEEKKEGKIDIKDNEDTKEKEPKKMDKKKKEGVSGETLVSLKMTSKAEAKTNIKTFKEKGISFIESLTEQQIEDMIVCANDAYYNTKTSLMTDNEYDIVKEYAEKTYPTNETIKQVGAPIVKNKTTLPFNMPSMDKIKPDTNALHTWTNKYKGPYVLSCKLDGVSGMFMKSAGEMEPKLYTRGDGTVGQDITHILRVLKLPDIEPGTAVRGEFILPKKVFDEKYKDQFANPRNLVSGIINSKTLDNKTRDLHFVAYEIIQPLMPPSEQMATLERLGFETVQNKTVEKVSNELLSDLLIDWRTNYMYEIDGVIVSDDNMHSRKDGNPDYAFAFKMVISDQLAEVKVVDVIWNASKSGYLKPRVRIEPVRLGGVTIEYATGFNGSFIETNKIGVGAMIQIIRSGDVIPYIKSITTPAEHAKMPDVKYHWTDTHVDIILDDIGEDVGVKEKEITAFFTGLSVDGLSSGNVKRIVKAGFDSVPKIIKMTKSEFETVEGFKTKMIEKVYTSLHDKVEKASLLEIMAVSNKFGRGLGERKIRPILEAYPDILMRKEGAEEKITMLKSIKGIGKENAKAFVEHIDGFLAFLRECGLEEKLNSAQEKPLENAVVASFDMSHPLYQKHIVMTKVRDQTIIDGLKRVGGVLDDSIGKNTFVLIVKSKDDVSNKTKYANEKGIPIMIPSEFIAQYLQ